MTYPAGPGDYDTGEDMKWNHRVVNVKGKGTTRPYATRGKDVLSKTKIYSLVQFTDVTSDLIHAEEKLRKDMSIYLIHSF